MELRGRGKTSAIGGDFSRRDRVQYTNGVSVVRAPGELGRAEDRRRSRDIGELGIVVDVAAELRRTPDTSRVENAQARDVAAEVATEAAEIERAGAGDEERPLLREERLERREIHNRRIGFDLTEVGINRRVEREV